MTERCYTSLGKAVAWFVEDEARFGVPPADGEVLRPRCAPHSAAETYVLAGCLAMLGWLVCQDLLGRAFGIGDIAKMAIAVPLTPLFLQVLGMALVPVFRSLVGAALFVLLTVYAIVYLPTCPVTVVWIALCGLNLTCWLFRRIAALA